MHDIDLTLTLRTSSIRAEMDGKFYYPDILNIIFPDILRIVTSYHYLPLKHYTSRCDDCICS